MLTMLGTLKKIDCINAFTIYLHQYYKKQITNLNVHSNYDASAQFYFSKDKKFNTQVSIDPESEFPKGSCSCERNENLCIHQILLAHVLKSGVSDEAPQEWKEITFMEPIINVFIDAIDSINTESDCLELIRTVGHNFLSLESNYKLNEILALYMIVVETGRHYLSIFRDEKLKNLAEELSNKILDLTRNITDVKLAEEFENTLYTSFVRDFMLRDAEKIDLYFTLLNELNILSGNFTKLKELIYIDGERKLEFQTQSIHRIFRCLIDHLDKALDSTLNLSNIRVKDIVDHRCLHPFPQSFD